MPELLSANREIPLGLVGIYAPKCFIKNSPAIRIMATFHLIQAAAGTPVLELWPNAKDGSQNMAMVNISKCVFQRIVMVDDGAI